MASWFRRNRRGPERAAPPSATPPADGTTGLGEDSPAELNRLVSELVWYVNAHAGHLPNQSVVTARYVCDLLSATIATSTTRELDVYAVISVRAIASDYLRTSVATYLAAAQTMAGSTTEGTDPNAALLDEQLNLLWDSAAEVFAAAKSRDLDALRTQGNFLRTKFSRSDLQL
ncbi:hypothetical protein GOEFS_004_00060 [Gordonia effusa NBRC 100432]|uniref:Uncharacterized protein n=1 Tax=Gordonia effusa NBRC 100432 TaxID=1077974 RepID=H0QUJ0_9ACTN|nr:hypothetical protein [Gordonia effusa]GAB16491.1 hypothetical protein GOEFS_004_00060 [Gordonia effusa NBRC 100432]